MLEITAGLFVFVLLVGWIAYWFKKLDAMEQD